MLLYDVDGPIIQLSQSIAELQKQVVRLQQQLAERQGQLEASQKTLDALQKSKETLLRLNAQTVEIDEGSSGRQTRKKAIIEFLTKSGPMKRADLVEATGIPAGTVSYELNDKETFCRLEDGRWSLRKLVTAREEEDDGIELTEDDIPF